MSAPHGGVYGGVYLIHAVGTPYYKAGRSFRVFGRISAIQSHSPFACELLFFAPVKDNADAVALERSLLDALSAWRSRGEWFCIDSDADIRLARRAMAPVFTGRLVLNEAQTRRHYGITKRRQPTKVAPPAQRTIRRDPETSPTSPATPRRHQRTP